MCLSASVQIWSFYIVCFENVSQRSVFLLDQPPACRGYTGVEVSVTEGGSLPLDADAQRILSSALKSVQMLFKVCLREWVHMQSCVWGGRHFFHTLFCVIDYDFKIYSL